MNTTTTANTMTTSSYYHTPVGALRMHHLQSACLSWKRLWRHPLATSLTLMVIAVSLALPTLLMIVLSNATALTQHWNGGSHVSIYLSLNSNQQRAQQIMTLLKERYPVQQMQYVSPSEGLAQFERDTGIQNVREQLHTNPLPAVIDLVPDLNQATATQLQTWVESIQQFPGVDSVQFDLAWVNRLNQLVSFAERMISVLAVLLALAVLLVIGNTIRLATQNRQQEIYITKLIGATNTFVRRPFLYTGFFYGLSGAVFAWLVVALITHWLSYPVAQLAQSYHSDFQLQGLTLDRGIGLLAVGALLGWVGAWLAVTIQLKQFVARQ